MNKRVFSLFVVVFGLMLVVAACGGNATEAPVAQTEAAVVVTEAPVAATEAPVSLSGDPIRGGLLAMPRHRPEPGSSEPGFGALRGRFGTPLESHGAGTLVYSFPTRWMDGYEPRCADPSLTWLELGFEAPGAQWRGLAYEEESADGTQHVRVLARTGTARWDDDPLKTPGLVELTKGQSQDGGFVRLGLRDDRLELRFFFDWEAGSFDAQTFVATGWTQAPRVRRIMLDYLAQTRIEKVEEIVE